MSSVHNYWVIKELHLSNPSHIAYQAVITKAAAAFDQDDFVVVLAFDFINDVFHVLRSHKLRFFDLDGFLGLGGGD